MLLPPAPCCQLPPPHAGAGRGAGGISLVLGRADGAGRGARSSEVAHIEPVFSCAVNVVCFVKAGCGAGLGPQALVPGVAISVLPWGPALAALCPSQGAGAVPPPHSPPGCLHRCCCSPTSLLAAAGSATARWTPCTKTWTDTHSMGATDTDSRGWEWIRPKHGRIRPVTGLGDREQRQGSRRSGLSSGLWLLSPRSWVGAAAAAPTGPPAARAAASPWPLGLWDSPCGHGGTGASGAKAGSGLQQPPGMSPPFPAPLSSCSGSLLSPLLQGTTGLRGGTCVGQDPPSSFGAGPSRPGAVADPVTWGWRPMGQSLCCRGQAACVCLCVPPHLGPCLLRGTVPPQGSAATGRVRHRHRSPRTVPAPAPAPAPAPHPQLQGQLPFACRVGGPGPGLTQLHSS